MSDLMGNPRASENVKENMSVYNPVDIAAMKTPGNPGYVDPESTTIRDFFAQKGVDVDGPVSQLIKFAQGERKKANPIQKMQGIAGGAEKGGAFPGMPPDQAGGDPRTASRMPQGRSPEVGLDELRKMMGG